MTQLTIFDMLPYIAPEPGHLSPPRMVPVIGAYAEITCDTLPGHGCVYRTRVKITAVFGDKVTAVTEHPFFVDYPGNGRVMEIPVGCLTEQVYGLSAVKMSYYERI